MDDETIIKLDTFRNKLEKWHSEGYDIVELKGEFKELIKYLKSITPIGPNSQGYEEYSCEMDGSIMVLIPAGEFLRKSPIEGGGYSEHPIHKVYLYSFYIDKYDVTNVQFCRFLNIEGNQIEGGSRWLDVGISSIEKKGNRFYPKSGLRDHPVTGISWYGANAYAEWIGKRLPTEAEWEKAARGDLEGKKYPWGNSISHDNANYYGIGGKDKWNKTSPVGNFPPNGYGLYDMAGNVWEWCSDWYDVYYYKNSPDSNPEGPLSGEYRVVRGGSWSCGSWGLCCAYRAQNDARLPSNDIGFRCACSQL